MDKLLGAPPKIASAIFIRLAVGLIFFTQGILKYIDPHMGVLRFTKIGFPYPDFTAHFVGTFEIACGFLVLIGLFTSRLGKNSSLAGTWLRSRMSAWIVGMQV